MANINQIEIKRGTANGTIETQLFNIGNGGSIAAYGIIDSVTIDPNNLTTLLLTAKLLPEYENFTFIEDELICLRMDRLINIPHINNETCVLKVYLKNSDGTVTIENGHNLVRRFSEGSAANTIAPINSISGNMAILILCQQEGATESSRYYHQVADNFTPQLSNSGILTIV